MYIIQLKLLLMISDCMRKSARGEVTIWGNGSGKIIINGRDITYFEEVLHRQQVSYFLAQIFIRKINIKFVEKYC